MALDDPLIIEDKEHTLLLAFFWNFCFSSSALLLFMWIGKIIIVIAGCFVAFIESATTYEAAMVAIENVFAKG
ncbi:transmembrane protein, putative [Medicago truncatula]|uniref:Transmembrane protein, putative n=1 Tax=Medicago truncatula TaxID=3880 RepID=G7KTF9_MEDTR|nr:transmembrane protein, putative [Medicago truncatula]